MERTKTSKTDKHQSWVETRHGQNSFPLHICHVAFVKTQYLINFQMPFKTPCMKKDFGSRRFLESIFNRCGCGCRHCQALGRKPYFTARGGRGHCRFLFRLAKVTPAIGRTRFTAELFESQQLEKVVMDPKLKDIQSGRRVAHGQSLSRHATPLYHWTQRLIWLW